DHLRLDAPASASAGVGFSATVSARDAYNNLLAGFTGTVSLASSDPAASLPAAYSFQASDGGQHSFNGLVLTTAGAQTLSATDTAGHTASQPIQVMALPAPIITSHPDDPTTGTAANFTFVDAEAGVTFACQLDGGGFTPCTSPRGYAGPLVLGL